MLFVLRFFFYSWSVTLDIKFSFYLKQFSADEQKEAIRHVVLQFSRWDEIFSHWGHRGRREGHTYPWKKATLFMGCDHAKLVEIPLGHQMPHYNIFTETSIIPFLNNDFFLSFLPSLISFFIFLSLFFLLF